MAAHHIPLIESNDLDKQPLSTEGPPTLGPILLPLPLGVHHLGSHRASPLSLSSQPGNASICAKSDYED